MGLETQLTSNNSTYNTKTGGTHTSNVHHANTDHTSKMFKKGTVDLATANSHKVAGGAGGPSRSAAGAAGGLAAGGHGGQGGQVIIHHQAPAALPQPDKMTSAELLGAAIGSTIAVILIIIAGAIICRSVYRDQTRTFKKRRDKKNAKKARDTESVSTASRSEEIERLTSVLPDVTVPPAIYEKIIDDGDPSDPGQPAQVPAHGRREEADEERPGTPTVDLCSDDGTAPDAQN